MPVHLAEHDRASVASVTDRMLHFLATDFGSGRLGGHDGNERVGPFDPRHGSFP